MVRPAPGLTLSEQPEGVLKRCVLWGEARGEDNFTKLCILHVIANRVRKHGSTWTAEILKPWAFSSFNHDDPNSAKLLIGYQLEPASWAACDAVAELFPMTTDPTNGADHYYRTDMDPAPKWGRGHADWQERLVTGGMAFGICP